MALSRVRDTDGAGVWDGKMRAEVEYAARRPEQKPDTLVHPAHVYATP